MTGLCDCMCQSVNYQALCGCFYQLLQLPPPSQVEDRMTNTDTHALAHRNSESSSDKVVIKLISKTFY